MRFWKAMGFDPLPALPNVEWEVAYSNDVEQGKRTTRSYSHPFFDDDSRAWSKRTGINGLEPDATIHGGGLQVISPGGYLGVHLDYRHHPVVPARVRAMSIVAFMNEEWREEWGGALTFNRPDGSVWERIYPKPRLVVAFECGEDAWHGVEKVTGPVPRITLAKSFLLPAGRSRAVFLPNRMSA